MTRSQLIQKNYGGLLKEWKECLELSALEKVQLDGEIQELSKQINHLENRHIRVTAFGRVGVGKSSLLNAVLGKKVFDADIAHGFTRKEKGVISNQLSTNLQTIELVDIPGINEIAAKRRECLAFNVALHSDLVLLVLDSDITSIELKALKELINNGKPVILILNRCDQWDSKEKEKIVKSIRSRLPNSAKNLAIETVSAAPREARIFSDGRVRRQESFADVFSLKKTLLNVLEKQGHTFLILNTLRQAESFYLALKSRRLKRRKSEAQGLIGKFAAIKASGVAANPLLMFDLAAGLALDTALVIQLSKIYGLELKGNSARKLLQKLSVHNGLLGGVQLSIQLTLSAIQHLLFLASPFTGGISILSAAPVAIAQAAVAVHTTKVTGRLAAQELLQNNNIPGSNPSLILRKLIRDNSYLNQFLFNWNISSNKKSYNPSLLP